MSFLPGRTVWPSGRALCWEIGTAVYWEIGRRIVETEQAGTIRANYGGELIMQLANDLSGQFGRGFGVVSLSQMRRFFLAWPVKGIFQTPSEKSLTVMELTLRAAAERAVLSNSTIPARMLLQFPGIVVIFAIVVPLS
jgi:hypothetical protein